MPLLTAQDEVELAKAIEAGLFAEEKLQGGRAGRLRRRAAAELCPARRRRDRGQAAADRGQPAAGRVDRQALHRPRTGLPRPDPGGQPGPDPRGGEVRLHQGLQVLHLRHLVDPAGHHPGHRGPGPDDPDPGAHGRDHQQDGPDPAPAASGPGPRGHAGGDRARRWGCPRTGWPRSSGSPRSRSRCSRRSARKTPTSATSSRTPTRSCPWRRRRSSCSRTSWSRCSTTSAIREQRIIQLRFGLTDGHPRTLEEVGREFGVTRERIRQIESKTLAKLRHPSRAQMLREYLA